MHFSHLFVCPSRHPSILFFIHSFISSFIPSFVCSLICLFVHSFSHSFIHSSLHPCVYSFLHSFIPSAIHSCNHAFIHSCIFCMSSLRVRYDTSGSQHTNSVLRLPQNINKNAIKMICLDADACLLTAFLGRYLASACGFFLEHSPSLSSTFPVKQLCVFSWDHQRIQQAAEGIVGI